LGLSRPALCQRPRTGSGPARLADLEALTGIETRRIHVDKGYRGHNHTQKFRVRISGQMPSHRPNPSRDASPPAVEPVIGYMKAEHRMRRNYLKGRHGDRCNGVLAAAGYNFRLLLGWLESLLRALIRVLLPTPWCRQTA
jgi:IS5 family transposase